MSNIKNQPAIVFGKVVKTLRSERGITQNQLADMINSERSHISDLERGVKSPSLAMIFRIATAFQLPAGELVQLVANKLE